MTLISLFEPRQLRSYCHGQLLIHDHSFWHDHIHPLALVRSSLRSHLGIVSWDNFTILIRCLQNRSCDSNADIYRWSKSTYGVTFTSTDIHYAQTTLSLHRQGGKRKCTFCSKSAGGCQAYVSTEVGKDFQGVIHRQKQDVRAIGASVEINPSQAVHYSSRKFSYHETWIFLSFILTVGPILNCFPQSREQDTIQLPFWLTETRKNTGEPD